MISFKYILLMVTYERMPTRNISDRHFLEDMSSSSVKFGRYSLGLFNVKIHLRFNLDRTPYSRGVH